MPAQPIAVLTRPNGLNAPLEHALTQAGWHVTISPGLQIHPRAMEDREPFPHPADFDLVVFVSGNAVAGYASQWASERAAKEPWPASTLAACVGLTTAQNIQDAFGASVEVLHPAANEIQDSESLWRVITNRPIMPGRVLILRGQDGRDWLADQFVAKGVSVQLHVVYCRELATWSPELKIQFSQWAQASKPVVWLLTSPHGIESVMRQMDQAGLSQWAADCRYLVTHPRLVEVVRDHLQSVASESCAGDHAPAQNETYIDISRGDLPSLVSGFEKIRQHLRQN